MPQIFAEEPFVYYFALLFQAGISIDKQIGKKKNEPWPAEPIDQIGSDSREPFEIPVFVFGFWLCDEREITLNWGECQGPYYRGDNSL